MYEMVEEITTRKVRGMPKKIKGRGRSIRRPRGPRGPGPPIEDQESQQHAELHAAFGATLDRIDDRLATLGLTHRQASIMSGMSDDLLRTQRKQWLKRSQHGMNPSTMLKLAAALCTSTQWLLRGEGPKEINGNGHPDLVENVSERPRKTRRNFLPVIDKIVADVWVGVHKGVDSALSTTTIPSDPRYSHDKQLAVFVDDNSVEPLARRGDFLITVKIDEGKSKSGDYVIVKRTKDNLREVTAQRYIIRDDGMIELRNKGGERVIGMKAGEKYASDGSEIEIVGIIVAVHRQV
jgi:hypothetical protein